jgi:PEGA domain
MVRRPIESSPGDDRAVGKRELNGPDGPSAFDWPPVLQVLDGRGFEFTSQSGERNHPESAVTAAVDRGRPLDALPKSPAAPQQEDPQIALRRALQQRASTRTPPPKLRLRRASLRSRAIPIALAAFALIAVVEGVVILRQLSLHDAGVSAPNPPPPSAAPVSQATSAAVAESIVTTLAPRVENASKPAVATHGRLVIRSEPAGAQVVINGRPYGVTPLRLVNVVPGEHNIELRRDGTEVRQTVRVEPGVTVSVVAPLKTDGRASGWVAIDSPIEIDLFEGGSLLGTSRSRQIMVHAGTHNIQFVNEPTGFQHTQQVRVEAGKVERIAVELPRSTINVNATPWAEVWIDGKSVGETPIGNLSIAIGPHEVVFRHPELGEKVMSAIIKVGVPTRLTADLRR